MKRTPVPRLLAESMLLDQPGICAGALECQPAHPDFHDLGPVSNYVVAFPMSPILLSPIDGRGFVGSPGTAVMMHKAQRILRDAIAPAGDRCFWIGLDEPTAREIAEHTGNRVRRGSDFRFASFGVDISAPLYVAARRVQASLGNGTLEAGEATEQLLDLATRVLSCARKLSRPATSSRLRSSDVELVHETRRLVLAAPSAPLDVGEIARRFDVSKFRLARAFRAVTGNTLTHFSVKTRVLMSTSHLDRDHHLSALAHDFGFASHSHYTAWFSRLLGVTPSEYRGRVRVASKKR